MTVKWGNVREFCEIMITYSNEQKFDLTYLWKKLNWSVKLKNSGNNMTKDQNVCEGSSFFTR